MVSFFAIFPFRREEPLEICDEYEIAQKIREELKLEGIRTYILELTELELVHFVLTDIIDNEVFDYSRKGYEDYGL